MSSDSAKYLGLHYSQLTDIRSDFRNCNLIDLISSFVKGKSVLDIGSGIGLLLDTLQRKGLQSYGLEPNESLIEISKGLNPDLEIIRAPAEDLVRVFSHTVDTVTLVDVLEHIANDKDILQSIRSCLNPDGRLIIVVPAHPFLYGKRDKNAGHYRRYSKKMLLPLLTVSGYTIVSCRHWNSIGLLPYFFYERLLHREFNLSLRNSSNKNFFYKYMKRILFLWVKYIENRVDFGFGLSLVCVADKKE